MEAGRVVALLERQLHRIADTDQGRGVRIGSRIWITRTEKLIAQIEDTADRGP